jgi:LCP family protein required for cell wall assembly
MKSYKHTRLKKIILITSLSVASAVLLISIIAFLVIQSYINKINIVSPDKINSNNEAFDNKSSGVYDINDADLNSLINNTRDSDDANLEETDDDVDPNATDSPKEEIDLAEKEIRTNMEENQTQIMEGNDVINIILIGSDTRKAGGPGRSDAMIIISIKKKSKTITATSIMRDIYLHIPGRRNNRINAAYAVGGADLLMDTIEQNFKIELDRYASVDFYAFIDIIDIVGGVTIDVTQRELSAINFSVVGINKLTGVEKTKDQLTEPGLQLLNGKQALGYARIRKVGNSDFERTARQRRVLEQVFDNIKDLNLLELNDLANVILPQVTTNLTKGEIFSLLLGLPSYANYDIQQLRIPIDGSYTNMRIRGMSVLNVDFDKNINEIQQKIYQTKIVK